MTSKLNSKIPLLLAASALLSAMLCAQRPGTFSRENSTRVDYQEKARPLHASSVRPMPAHRRDSVLANLEHELGRCFSSTNAIEREFAKTNLFVELVFMEPGAAARFSESLPEGEDRKDALRRVAESWGARDVVQALQWAENLKESAEQQAATTQICFQWSNMDPAGAVRLARERTVDPGASEGLIQNWADKDFPKATEWIAALPPGDERDRLNARAAFIKSQTDPATAAKLVAERIPTGDAQTEAAISVLHQWALKDITGAATWASQFGNGQIAVRAQSEIQLVLQAKFAIEQYIH
ncbi:MAG: hypothetical protein JWN25_2789 [Verrucomicrobiales bacterium]|nr:hypothetical protein [Verrucomicrobiales bacterium]